MKFIAEMLTRLIIVLVKKRLLNVDDLRYVYGENTFRQMALTASLIQNGVLTEEDLQRLIDNQDN